MGKEDRTIDNGIYMVVSEQRVQIEALTERVADLEEQIAVLDADEFISAGLIRRSLVVLGYALFGCAQIGVVLGVLNWLWGWWMR